MIAPPTPAAGELAACGCAAADVSAGLHPEGDCVTQYLIAIAEADLPGDPDPYRLRVHTAEPKTSVSGLHLILPPRGIIAGNEGGPMPDDGLWQLHTDGYLVPISMDTYRAHVRRCLSQGCDQCQECRELGAFIESRKKAHERLDEAVDKVRGALREALKLLAEVGSGSVDVDEDLSGIDSRDLKVELEEAERRTRAAKRITELHLANLANLRRDAGGDHA